MSANPSTCIRSWTTRSDPSTVGRFGAAGRRPTRPWRSDDGFPGRHVGRTVDRPSATRHRGCVVRANRFRGGTHRRFRGSGSAIVARRPERPRDPVVELTRARRGRAMPSWATPPRIVPHDRVPRPGVVPGDTARCREDARGWTAEVVWPRLPFDHQAQLSQSYGFRVIDSFDSFWGVLGFPISRVWS